MYPPPHPASPDFSPLPAAVPPKMPNAQCCGDTAKPTWILPNPLAPPEKPRFPMIGKKFSGFFWKPKEQKGQQNNSGQLFQGSPPNRAAAVKEKGRRIVGWEVRLSSRAPADGAWEGSGKKESARMSRMPLRGLEWMERGKNSTLKTMKTASRTMKSGRDADGLPGRGHLARDAPEPRKTREKANVFRNPMPSGAAGSRTSGSHALLLQMVSRHFRRCGILPRLCGWCAGLREGRKTNRRKRE